MKNITYKEVKAFIERENEKFGIKMSEHEVRAVTLQCMIDGYNTRKKTTNRKIIYSFIMVPVAALLFSITDSGLLKLWWTIYLIFNFFTLNKHVETKRRDDEIMHQFMRDFGQDI